MEQQEQLKLKRFVFNPFMENTYVIWSTLTLEAMIVDPGNSIPEEDETLADFITEQNLRVKYLINTHGHIDHVLGNAFVTRNYRVEHFVPKHDLFMIDNAEKHAALFGITCEVHPYPMRFIEDIAELFVGGLKAEFIATPGHTPGEFCILFREQKILFSGDVLFLESIGRTDLQGGNTTQLLTSIREKLFILDPETIVLPGHGDNTTIDYEIKNNPFFY